MTDNTEHSRVSPSSAYRWSVCPGSTWAVQQFTDKDSSNVYADAGNIIHNKAATILEEIKEQNKLEFLEQKITCSFTSNEVKILDLSRIYVSNAINFIRAYIDYIAKVERNMFNRAIYIEQKLDFTKIAPGLTYDEQNKGTADCVIYDRAKKHLHVIDLKTGMGRVAIKDNKQLLIYAIGALLEISEEVEVVITHIVQPSINNFGSCYYSIEEMEQWKRYFYEKVIATLTPLAPRVPSQDGCKYCPANKTCPELAGLVKEVVDIAKTDNKYNQETMLYILNNSKLISSYLDQVKDHAYNQLESGLTFGNYKLVPGRTLKNLTSNAEEVLRAKYGNSIYQLAPVSKLKEVVASEDLEPLIEYKQSKPMIVQSSEEVQEFQEEL